LRLYPFAPQAPRGFYTASAISGPSALSPNFLQSGHASSSINGQPYSGAKGEPLREVAQI
jgi:hypothetical protein